VSHRILAVAAGNAQRAQLLGLSGLVLAAYWLGLFACPKDRSQNNREQKYPATGGQDDSYQSVLARHLVLSLGRSRHSLLVKWRPLIAHSWHCLGDVARLGLTIELQRPAATEVVC